MSPLLSWDVTPYDPRLAILDEMRRHGPTPEVISLATAVDACVAWKFSHQFFFEVFWLGFRIPIRTPDARNVGQLVLWRNDVSVSYIIYIYIYPRGRRFTGNSCAKGVYIYEVGVGLGWGGDGNVPWTCTHGRCYASHGIGVGLGWGW